MRHNFLNYSIFGIFFCVLVVTGHAQDYWQQKVDYKMDINFDVETNQFEGSQTLNYKNNSPDTLNGVFYHLYFNAFQPGSMMDPRSRIIEDEYQRITITSQS